MLSDYPEDVVAVELRHGQIKQNHPVIAGTLKKLLYSGVLGTMERRVRLSHHRLSWRCAHVLVVTKLEWLARSIAVLMAILRALGHKHVVGHISPRGRNAQMAIEKGRLTVLGRAAEFERELMGHR